MFVSCAVTRAMSKNNSDVLQDLEPKPEDSLKMTVTGLSVLSSFILCRELIKAQQGDDTLKEMFTSVLPLKKMGEVASGYFVEDGVLVRKWLSGNDVLLGQASFQVVVPTSLRETVLKMAHGDVAGHFRVNKVHGQLLRYFYWPHMKKDVRQYIKTCPTCQLTGKPNQPLKLIPLYPFPAVESPF